MEAPNMNPARRLRARERSERGLVATYIHELSDRHARAEYGRAAARTAARQRATLGRPLGSNRDPGRA